MKSTLMSCKRDFDEWVEPRLKEKLKFSWRQMGLKKHSLVNGIGTAAADDLLGHFWYGKNPSGLANPPLVSSPVTLGVSNI